MKCLHRNKSLVKTPTEDWQWTYQILCRVCMAISAPMPTGWTAKFQWEWELSNAAQVAEVAN